MRLRLAFRGCVSLVLFAFAAGAGAQNAVPNPNFDTGLAPWITAGDAVGNFSTKDFAGATTSGSGHVVVSPANPHTSSGFYSPCTPNPAGSSFSAGGSFFIPSGQSRTALPEVTIWWYSDTTCGPTHVVSTANKFGSQVLDTWFPLVESGASPPVGSQSYLISLNLEKVEAGGSVEGFVDNAFFVPGSVPSPCLVNASTICLHGGRFGVTANWRTASDQGAGAGVKFNDDSGYFYFFDSENTEVVAKVHNACVDPWNSYWVFAAGLTNVEVTITVIDSVSGLVRTYVNPLNTPFAPIQDTFGIVACP